MSMSLALGLDLGTTSISAIAVDDSGRVVASVTRNHAADVADLPAGHAEQEPATIRQVAFSVLRELTAELSAAGRNDRPAALGLTGQMHGVLLLDTMGRPASRLITWQDRRAVATDPGGRGSLLATLLERCPEAALRDAGCRLSTGFGGTTLFVLRETGRLPQAPTRAALIVDWLSTELTGGPLCTDPTNAASLGLYDLRLQAWSAPLLAAAKVESGQLPELRESGAVIGAVTPAAAVETGLPSGLPVCNAIGDNPAAILGSVPGEEDVVQINIGTGGQLARILSRFVTLPELETRPLPIGRQMLVGAGLAGGDAFAWVQRTIRQWLRTFGAERSDDEIYALLEREMQASRAEDRPTVRGESTESGAPKVFGALTTSGAPTASSALLTGHEPPAGGLECVPCFRGTRQRPQARGEFRGISADNFTPGNVGRAVLAAIAAQMRRFYELAASVPAAVSDRAPTSGASDLSPPAGWPAQRIIATGNAVRRNPLLIQTIADAIGLPIDVPMHREEAAYGAALLAGAQTGLWPDLSAAVRCIRHERVATPFSVAAPSCHDRD